MNYPAETRKKQKWVDIFCPRCGEPLGFKDMPKVGCWIPRVCYDCGGECIVIRKGQYEWNIIYKREA